MITITKEQIPLFIEMLENRWTANFQDKENAQRELDSLREVVPDGQYREQMEQFLTERIEKCRKTLAQINDWLDASYKYYPVSRPLSAG